MKMGLKKNLKLWKQTKKEKAEENVAAEVEEASRTKAKAFPFSSCDIQPGEKIEFFCGNSFSQ